MRTFAVACLLAIPAVVHAEPGLRLPPGFEATLFADSDLANDIYCLTVGPKGQVVVSGRGYVRQLVAGPGGKAVRALDFTGAPKDGAMGLFWEGDRLFAMGDGGLNVWDGAGGAGRLAQPRRLLQLRTGGEHLAHAIRRGPDGWLYVLCGDGTGPPRGLPLLPTSPRREPTTGYVLRIAPDFKGMEIVAEGLRNSYGMDFNADGELFTFDSDNERCVGLPWYEPTRVYHVTAGAHHGWLGPKGAATWRKPPWFLDVTAPIATCGRGSPTGVVCYRHGQFPAKYRGGLFLLDWTFGQVHFLPLERSGSSYKTTPEVFLRVTGDNGFAPTAAAVDPGTGDLFLSIGGRGTRGAVYRVRYPKGLPGAKALAPAPRLTLDWRPESRKALLASATGPDLLARRRALEAMWRHRARFSAEELARAIRASAGESDRGVRQAAARLLASLEEKERARLVRGLSAPRERLTAALAVPTFEVADLIDNRAVPAALRLEAVRVVQLALGGPPDVATRGTVWEGYSRPAGPALPERARKALRAALPSSDANLDRELARTLTLVEDGDAATLARVAAFLSPASHPTDDVHYLIALARLAGPRTPALTKQVAAALLALDRKVAQRRLNLESNWPLRLGELYAGLVRRDPALPAALLGHPDFGRPDHALFARGPGIDRRKAAEVFLGRAKTPGFAWNAELVELVAGLPPERALPALRRLWGEHGLDEEILAGLARSPRAEDRGRFTWGLGSARLATVERSLAALNKLPTPSEKAQVRDEVVALVRALRQAPPEKAGEALRKRLGARLRLLTKQEHTTADGWAAWAGRAYPERAALLADGDGVDVAAWEKRLAGIDWLAGDAERGRAIYQKASCAACHSGTGALGPDLRGVAGRFSRADLFTAILRPSKEVPARYRTTVLTTTDGKTYQGIIVYEAFDSVLLLTGPAVNVRVANRQIAERRLTATSLMPTGLLDRAGDRDIADLYAYLRSLTGKPRRRRRGGQAR
jgi:putative heme-binding domain-containing protein